MTQTPLRLSILILFVLAFFSGCGTPHKSNPPRDPSSSTTAAVPAPRPPMPSSALTLERAPAPTAPMSMAPTTHDTEEKGVSAEQAYGWLKNGNTRFVKGKRWLRADGQTDKDREKLTLDQKPHTIVLSCSDSRVPPEIVFDQKLGEIFVIRTAGEALDSSAIASVEYAVEHLGAHLILVMGHENCGAVKAALATPSGQSAGSPALDALVADIRPRLPQAQRDQKTESQRATASEPSPNVAVESLANARGVAQDLVKRSDIIRSKVSIGSLQIKSALYEMKTGRVKFD